MTEPKLDAATLRWAAQYLLKFRGLCFGTTTGAIEFCSEYLDRRACEAEAKRKAGPGCTCSPSPGMEDDKTMRCPSCLGAYREKFEAALAASLKAAEAIQDAKLTQDELDAIRHVAEHGSNPSGYIIRLLNEHAELTVEITELRAQLAEFT